MELIQFPVRSGDNAIWRCCDMCVVKLQRPNCLTDFDKTISRGTVGGKSVDKFWCSVGLVPPLSTGSKLRFAYFILCSIVTDVVQLLIGCFAHAVGLLALPIRAEMNCTTPMYDSEGPPCTSHVLVLSFVYLPAECICRQHITNLSSTPRSRIALNLLATDFFFFKF